jgi:hypothetical protein
MTHRLFKISWAFAGIMALVITSFHSTQPIIAQNRQISFQSSEASPFLEDQKKCLRALKMIGVAAPRSLSEAEHAPFYQAWELAERTYGPQSKEARDLFQLYDLVTERQPHLDLEKPFLVKVTSSFGETASKDHLNEWAEVLRRRTPASLKAVMASAAIASLMTPPVESIHQMMGDPLFSLSSAVAVVGSTLLLSKGLESKVVSPSNRFLSQAERILENPNARNTTHLQWRVRMPALSLLDEMKKKTSSTTFYYLSQWIYAQQTNFVEVIFDHNMSVDSQGSPVFVNAVRIARADEQNP